MQSGSRGEIDREVRGKDWSKAVMPPVTFSVYLGYRLDYESCHKLEKKWDSVDLVDTVGRPGLCGRSSASVKNHKKMQAETSDLHHTSVQLGLTINNRRQRSRGSMQALMSQSQLKGQNWGKLSLLPIWAV